MKKDNLLFGIIGILLGLLVGFVGANSLNKSASNSLGSGGTAAGTMADNSNMPPGHPDIGAQGGPTMQEIQTIVQNAKSNPGDFDAQRKAAEVYSQIGRYADSVTYLRQANSIKPDDVDVQIQLGNALFDSNDYAEAGDWYIKALTKRADNVDVRTDLGITYMLREPAQMDKAIDEFQKALKIKPGYLNTLQNLTFAYIKKPDLPKAKATLAEVEKGGADPDVLKRLREELGKVEGVNAGQR